jgi:hypothetical protein
LVDPFLARERVRLFPSKLFANLFEQTGRCSVPPSILAVVMVPQTAGGVERSADRFIAFDVRWNIWLVTSRAVLCRLA